MGYSDVPIPRKLDPLDWWRRGENGWRRAYGHDLLETQLSFSLHDSYSRPALYAIQLHLYPNEMMQETIDGVMKSPVYWLRLRK